MKKKILSLNKYLTNFLKFKACLKPKKIPDP